MLKICIGDNDFNFSDNMDSCLEKIQLIGNGKLPQIQLASNFNYIEIMLGTTKWKFNRKDLSLVEFEFEYNSSSDIEIDEAPIRTEYSISKECNCSNGFYGTTDGVKCETRYLYNDFCIRKIRHLRNNKYNKCIVTKEKVELN